MRFSAIVAIRAPTPIIFSPNIIIRVTLPLSSIFGFSVCHGRRKRTAGHEARPVRTLLLVSFES